jgi:microcystin-dependent protein
MPLTPTANWSIPKPALGDDANIETAVGPVSDRLEVILNSIGPTYVGMSVGWVGFGEPAALGGEQWVLEDGRLIDKTTYAVFFATVGHAFNLGVDPGSNKVRIPDARGRVDVGADNMGTAGAAGRLPNSNRALGQTGGEERHLLTSVESGEAGHTPSINFGGASNNHILNDGAGPTSFADAVASGQATITRAAISVNPVSAASAAAAHNIMQLYQVKNRLVRIK